jgi:small subunit ribosomal protein S21
VQLRTKAHIQDAPTKCGFRQQQDAKPHWSSRPEPDWRNQRRKEPALKVFVRENNVDQALRVLKKKLQREGLFRELKRRKGYEKPSERRAREKGEAIRRRRKAARKLAQREGLIATPRLKRRVFGRR